jgi:RsiW-degrading membrane proteinase PrsW (M82 family)
MLSVFIAFLPALFMWEFASIKVNFRLPKALRKRLFKTGSRFALLALVVELAEHAIPLDGLPPVQHAFAGAFLIAALTEELVKFAGVYRIGRRELNEIGPGIAILLAVGVSLGFAVLENKLYVFGGGFEVWLVRAVTAVPMHAVFGLVMGSLMAIAWRDYRRTDYVTLGLAIAVPVLFHGSYDFLLMLHEYNPALLWPMQVLPVLILVEGCFAMLVTNYALNGATAIYGKRIPSDPAGMRAATLAGIMLAVVVGFIWLDLSYPNTLSLPTMAAMPLVLALDLGLTAAVRLSPAR